MIKEAYTQKWTKDQMSKLVDIAQQRFETLKGSLRHTEDVTNSRGEKIRVWSDSSSDHCRFYLTTQDDHCVGYMLLRPTIAELPMSVSMVAVMPRWKNTGLGKILYGLAIKNNSGISSDRELTVDSRKIWKSLLGDSSLTVSVWNADRGEKPIDKVDQAFRNNHDRLVARPKGAVMESAGDEATLAHLRIKYAEYNKKFFKDQLPIIPLRWANLKNVGAQVEFKAIGLARGPKRMLDGSMVMAFSSKYQRSAEDLEPLLLHEMIHVYVIGVLGNIREHHGVDFFDKMREIERLSGLDIPLTDTTKGLKLTDDTVKPYGVILQYLTDGKVVYALVSPNALRTAIPNLTNEFPIRRGRCEARIVASQFWTEKAARTKVQRTVGRKSSFFYPKEEELADLLAHSQLLWSNDPQEV